MTRGWSYEITPPARRDLRRLDPPVQRRVIRALESVRRRSGCGGHQKAGRNRVAAARRRLARPLQLRSSSARDRRCAGPTARTRVRPLKRLGGSSDTSRPAAGLVDRLDHLSPDRPRVVLGVNRDELRSGYGAYLRKDALSYGRLGGSSSLFDFGLREEDVAPPSNPNPQSTKSARRPVRFSLRTASNTTTPAASTDPPRC